MDAKEVIRSIRTALSELQKTGQEFANIPSLYVYLDTLEKAVPTSAQTAEFQHQSRDRSESPVSYRERLTRARFYGPVRSEMAARCACGPPARRSADHARR